MLNYNRYTNKLTLATKKVVQTFKPAKKTVLFSLAKLLIEKPFEYKTCIIETYKITWQFIFRAVVFTGVLSVTGCTPNQIIPLPNTTQCVPPPIAYVTNEVEIKGNVVNVGELTYHLRPSVRKVAGDSGIELITAEYLLCKAIKEGRVPKNDPAAEEAWLRPRLDFIKQRASSPSESE